MTHVKNMAESDFSFSKKWQQWRNLLSSAHPHVPTHEQRNARLMAWLTLLLAVITTISTFLFSQNFSIFVSCTLFWTAYTFSRTTYFRIAAYIIVIGFGIVPFINAQQATLTVISPENLMVRMLWLILPFLIASAVLPLRQTVMVVAGFSLLLFLMPLYNFRVSYQALPQSISYILLTGGLIIIFTNHRRLNEQDRQSELKNANEALRASESSLEQRIIERTKELSEARTIAERANQVKSQFLAAMSHELRTPLNGIINLSEFLQRGLFGDLNKEQKDAALNVANSGKHLLALINDVLDISKIEAGSLQLFIEEQVNLEAELKGLQETAKTLLQSSEVQARLDIQGTLPLMRGDRLRIRQILLNLVSNACKFTDHGEILIQALAETDTIKIKVQDTGPGIKPDDLNAIFETFHQTEVGLRKGKGTGLGLPIARRLAEAHYGTLIVESVYGAGATFTVTLPIRSEQLTSPIEKDKQPTKIA